jgi:WD40 repeat protein
VHDGSGAVVATLAADVGRPLVATPDRRWAACDVGDKIVAIEMVTNGQVVPLAPAASTVSVTPAGRLLAGRHDGRVGAWDFGPGGPRALPESKISTVSIEWLEALPGGDSFVALDRRGALRAWRVDDGSMIRELGTLGYARHGLALREGGTAVLVSSSSGGLHVVGLDGERQGLPRLGSDTAVSAVAYVRGSQRIASVDIAGRLRLLTEPPAVEPRRFAGHASYVYDVEVDPTGERIASLAWDGTARIWAARDGSPLRTLRLAELEGRVVTWLPGGRIACGSNRVVSTHDTATGEILSRLELTAGPRGVAWDARTGRILVLDENAALLSWNPATGATRELLGRAAPAPRVGAVLASEGDVTVVAHGDRVLSIDTEDGSARWDVPVPCQGISDLDLAEGSLAASCLDGAVVLLDPGTGAERARFGVAGGSPVFAIALHPEGKVLAAGSQDGVVSTWDLDRRELVAQLRGHQDYVHALSFSPDGTLLVSGSGDGTVRTWDSLPMRERFLR